MPSGGRRQEHRREGPKHGERRSGQAKKVDRRQGLRIAIAFSGGTSKCAYQIGFTNALLNYVSRSEIKCVSGSSGGVFTAYGLSANKLDLIEDMYRKIDITKKAELFWQVFAKGLLSKHIDSIMQASDKLDIPMCFPVCFIPVLSTRYYWIYGDYNRVWERYVTAATCFPFLKVFPSIMRGRFAIDGGAVDNIPIYPLLKSREYSVEPLDLIFALHFDAQYEYRRIFRTDVPIIDVDLSICSNFEKEHFNYSSRIMDERIARAYEYGDNMAKLLFTGDVSREALQRKADEIFISEHAARQRNMSSDRLVSILNIIGRAFRSDTHCMKKLF